MVSKRRLARLAAVAARLEAAAPAAPEVVPWDAAVAEVGRLLGGGPGVATVDAYAAAHQSTDPILAYFWPGRPRPDHVRRAPAALVHFFARLPPDLRPAAATPDALLSDGRSQWAATWVSQLALFGTRLPPGLPEAVLRRVAGAFTARRAGGDDWDEVCAACGLRRPLWSDDAMHGRPCEGCGGGELVGGPAPRGGPFAWEAEARFELDAVHAALRAGPRPPGRRRGRPGQPPAGGGAAPAASRA